MKRFFSKKIIRVLACCFGLIFELSANDCLALNSRNLAVFAEQNMVTSLTKIARVYSQKNNVAVSVNFNSSSELMNDVESGEPADVFISAHLGLIESLKQKGLVDVYNVGHIARDKLVLVTTKNNKNIPSELAAGNIKLEEALKILNYHKAALIIDYEGNSSGKYSGDFVKSLTLNDLKLSAKLAEDKSPILNIVKENPDQYGLVLASQVKNQADWKILAASGDAYIYYQALVIAGDNMETAREFLKFMKSDFARNIFKDSGFVIE